MCWNAEGTATHAATHESTLLEQHSWDWPKVCAKAGGNVQLVSSHKSDMSKTSLKSQWDD